MSRYEKQVILRSTPFIHENVMLVDQFKRIGHAVYLYFKETLYGCPNGGHEPFAEGVAIAALIALVSVR